MSSSISKHPILIQLLRNTASKYENELLSAHNSLTALLELLLKSMLIETKPSWQCSENEVTNEDLFNSRRKFLQSSLYGAGAGLSMAAYLPIVANASISQFTDKIGNAKTTIDAGLTPNSYEQVTKYNNFYELGTGKNDPVRNADKLKTEPWSVTVEGECGKSGTYSLEDILKPHDFEERIYRFRCVETWSAVIPWLGFSLGNLLTGFEPNNNAKYVAFETIFDRKNRLPGQKKWFQSLPWPYREGLRMDEAMHPLAMMVVGMYGKPLPNQNGAPLRLIVPWKYGFKSIKSIVTIRFTKDQPETSWNMQAPSEYGFYSNVNPEVHHPRWSQASERRLGGFFKQKTLMFNGYEEEVAHLYKGMDLTKYY